MSKVLEKKFERAASVSAAIEGCGAEVPSEYSLVGCEGFSIEEKGRCLNTAAPGPGI